MSKCLLRKRATIETDRRFWLRQKAYYKEIDRPDMVAMCISAIKTLAKFRKISKEMSTVKKSVM